MPGQHIISCQQEGNRNNPLKWYIYLLHLLRLLIKPVCPPPLAIDFVRRPGHFLELTIGICIYKTVFLR